MARNLLKAGRSVVAFDVNSSAVDRLGAAGGQRASSPAEVAAGCSTVLTMLPSSPHVQSVFEGPRGVLSALRKDALCIDSSTIEPAVARSVAAAVAKAGAHMVMQPRETNANI